MKGKMQIFVKKSLSLLLALIMIFTILPYNATTVSAAVSSNRQIVVDYMKSMATIKWTAGKDFTTLWNSLTGSKVYWKSGRTYYGIPYSQTTSIKNNISNTTMISYATFKTMLENNNGKISKDIGRNDCSYTVVKAWTQVDSTVSQNTTRGLKPGSGSIVAVGSYQFKTDKLTTCKYNGKTKMYAAYDCLQPGDAVVKDGHIMMVVSVNKSKEYIKVIHQSGGLRHYDAAKDTTSSSGTDNTSWGINEIKSYSYLFSQGYIPITCKALANDTSVSYNLSGNDSPDSRTNTTNKITAKLNSTAKVQSWGYYFGTSESDVKAHKKDTEKSDFVTVKAYNKSGESMKTLSTTVKKLKSNTKYYYIIAAKIGDKWYYSNCFYGKTENDKPKSTTLKISSSYKNIGIKDTATVTWSAASGANSYTVKLYNSSNKEVYSKTDIKGTTFAFPASCFTSAGTYTAKLIAVNDAGSTECSGSPTITVHQNVTVTFYDTISKKNISKQSVTYGHDATAPANPSQTGYTFQKWDKSYTNVKSDITVNTVYDANKYTVKFVDGYNNETISSDKYTFNTTLDSSDYPTAPEHKYYKFIGWSEDEYTVGAATHTIYARYEWDLSTDIGTEIKSIERAKSDTSETTNDGYNVSVNVTIPAGTTKTIKGRVVVALKTANGRLLIETESAAFVLYPSSTEKQTKTIEVFVPYEATDEDLAAVTEVYVVNDYNSAGIISNVVSDTEKTAASNADEWQYSTTQPVVGENGVVAIDESLNKVTYDLKTVTTKDSLATSMSGYSLKTSAWEKVGSGTIKYVKSWPRIGNTAGQKSKGTEGSQFNKSTTVGEYLYNKYNNTPKTASETTTSKVTVSNVSDGAIYYHWCCNRDNGTLTHNVTGQKWYADTTTKNKYYTFHAFWVSAGDDEKWSATKTYVASEEKSMYVRNLSSTSSADHRDKCTDSKYWMSRLPVYKQTWVQYKKKFTYTKTEVQTGKEAATMSAVPANTSATTSTTSSGVTLNTTIAKTAINKTQWYAYKSEVSVTHDDKNEYDIAFELGADYADKEVTVYVYKDNQVADYTTEYIGTATADENGNISIPKAQMREECSESTGDFTVAVALPGETNAMVVDVIEAPKPVYTVTYYDYDGETIVYQATVEEGGTVTAPEADLLNVPEGCRFTGWDLSTVGVNSDLVVHPMSEKEVYNVVFVNWETQEIETKELEYGEYIEDYLPELEEIEGVNVSWDLSGCKVMETVENIDEETEEVSEVQAEVHIVTGNTVITTVSETMTSEVTFLSETSDVVESGVFDERDEDGCLLDYDVVDMISDKDCESVEIVEYSDRIDTPDEIEESEDYIFYGWKNVVTGEYLDDTETTESGTYYPVYTFANTVDAPTADITTGEYDSAQIVTLSCETENAVIYYTTDGTDPASSETAEIYTEPITLTTSCTLQFCAMALGMNNSGTVAELYAINTDTSGVNYHLVTVYSNLPQQEGEFYQALIKESAKFNDTVFKDIEGYQYNGLFYDTDFTDEFYVSAETITQSITLYANYTPYQYTATFVDDDGTALGESTADFGEAATPPEIAEKDGYVFIGWDSYDYECMTADKTFTAQYCLESEYATVKLNISQKSVEKGAAIQLKATIEPDELSDTELSWESDDSSVAEVDADGLVSFVGTGKATITVTVESSGESASCVFTVTPNSDEQITLAGGSIIDIDDSGYLRRIPCEANTVGELKDQFINETLYYYGADGTELDDSDRIGTGAVIRLMDGDTVLDEVTAVMTGDFNGDGKINSRDVSMLMQYTVDLRDINEYQAVALDVNGDGKVNNRDSAILSAYLVGKAEIE